MNNSSTIQQSIINAGRVIQVIVENSCTAPQAIMEAGRVFQAIVGKLWETHAEAFQAFINADRVFHGFST